MEKKPSGRPRIYDSTSEKVDAFRKRLEASGYLRKEVLVTTETWDRVTSLAKMHGVSASDAASGLLEEGLKAFEKVEREMPRFSRSDLPREAAARAVPLNPIQDFFAKRKESLQSVSLTKGTPEDPN